MLRTTLGGGLATCGVFGRQALNGSAFMARVRSPEAAHAKAGEENEDEYSPQRNQSLREKNR